MAQSYTRQSSFSDGDTITAALFNNEYNQLVNAFTYSSSSASSTGHRHDGTAGHGGNIHTIGDLDFLNKIVADSTNNRWGVFVEVSSAAVEQIRIQDGAIVPVTDNDIDLGTSSVEFKDLFIDGTAHIDTLDVDVNATIAGTLGVTGVLTGSSLDISGDIDIDGTSNLDVVDIDGAVDMATTLTVAGNVDFNGDLDVDGTTNLDVVDIDGAVDMATTLAVAGNVDFNGDLDVDGTTNLDVVDIDGAVDMASTLAVAGVLTGASLDISGDIDIDGTSNLDIVDIDGAVDMATTLTVGGEITAASLDISGNVDIDGTLETDALSLNGTTVTATAADINLIDGITNGTVIASKAIITDSNKDITGGRNITISGELDAATLDISGDADIDGTLEADAITIGGTTLAETISDTVGAMVSSNTETNITVTYEDSDNTLDFVIGTLNQDTTGTADNITVSANNSTDETVYPIFVDGATGSQGAESDTGLNYNPSTGMLTTTGVTATFTGNITGNVTGNTSGTAATVTGAAQSNITSLGTLTALTVDSVVIDGAVIGHTGDTDLITLSSGVVTVAGEVDATSLDISGDADIDGTLEADAITVGGSTLASVIAGTTVANATLAATTTVTDSTANTNFPVVFHDESNALLDDTGALRYNPSHRRTIGS